MNFFFVVSKNFCFFVFCSEIFACDLFFARRFLHLKKNRSFFENNNKTKNVE